MTRQQIADARETIDSEFRAIHTVHTRNPSSTRCAIISATPTGISGRSSSTTYTKRRERVGSRYCDDFQWFIVNEYIPEILGENWALVEYPRYRVPA